MSVSDKDGMPMVLIPAGEFIRGLSKEQLSYILLLCPDCNPEGLSDAQPQKIIILDTFWIDMHEVTNAQFAHFVTETGYVTTAEKKGSSYVMYWRQDNFAYVPGADWQHPFDRDSNITGQDDYPVTQVSWDDAHAYCNWGGRRLPTEAEWEKAARGVDGRLFPWGNEAPNPGLLNFDYNYKGPVSIGSYPESISPYGVLDMSGNVWEWVSDYYGMNYYGSAPTENPRGPSSGEGHTMRGGSWASEYKKYMYHLNNSGEDW